MEIINLTPHEVVVDGTKIPSHGLFRLKEVAKPVEGFPLPVVQKKYTEPTVIITKAIEGKDGALLVIVPLVVLQYTLSHYETARNVVLRTLRLQKKPNVWVGFASPDTGSGAIRNEQGRIVGVRRLMML